MFSCVKFDYVAKKETFLRKHMLTMHQDHVYKECKEKFKTFRELLRHVAKHHSSETDENKDLSAEDALKVSKNQQKEGKELKKYINNVYMTGGKTFSRS